MSTTRPPRPSPPWHGALFTAALFGGAGWLLTYTLLSVRPIEALGSWNYLGVLLLMLAAILLVAAWRGDDPPTPAPRTESNSVAVDPRSR